MNVKSSVSAVKKKKVVRSKKADDEKVKRKAKTVTKKKTATKKVKTATKKVKTATGKNLVIVESPTKAKTIKKYLGRGYQVIASNGHIKDLPKSKLGVDVDNNFETEIALITGKKTVLEKLHKYILDADTIYLAPDNDREGEAIAFHIAEEIEGKKKVHRILFNSVTKPAVIEAISNPVKLNQAKYDSQRTRRVLDRLVGYKISPILWDKVQRGLSAGRVQSVALRLMVERDSEIKAFVPEQWFSISVNFMKDDISFQAKYYGEQKDKKTDLLEQKVVDQIISDVDSNPYQIAQITKRERKQRPTAPFTTSKLQQEASSKLGFSAKKTMMVAQKLYEGLELVDHGLNGLITYMRTDSVRTEPDALNSVREYVLERYGKDHLSEEPIIYKKKKGGSKVQDAHEAIRPANLEFAPDQIKGDLSSDEFRLYELIWNKFVSSQMSFAVIDQTAVIFESGNHFFKANGSIIKFAGFRAIYMDSLAEKRSQRGGSENDDVEEVSSNKILPSLLEDEALKPLEPAQPREHWTSPPPRYTDASVVKDLEEKGIGRPSTYASIISNIVDRGYIEKIETRYLPTELGIVVCRMLLESFPNIMDVEFTAKVENLLDGIEEGEVKWTKVLKDFWGPFEKTLNIAKEEMKNLKKTLIPTGMKCVKCTDGEYHIKWGRNGQFFACSNYPECTSTEDFKKHLDESYEIIPKKYTKDPCPECGKRLIVKKGRFGRFLACEEYPNCKTTLPYTLDIFCPECKVGKFAEKKSRYGKIFYGCSSYPDCTNAMWSLPKEFGCTGCGYAVMGMRETKRLGIHLQCPKCKGTVPIDETPYAIEGEKE
ncbi:type I DNA topoisomerase [Bacteriovoracaceae bacterium]|nr:type I DNA topoisomerase [Bacteriovoracaceae bacterium]